MTSQWIPPSSDLAATPSASKVSRTDLPELHADALPTDGDAEGVTSRPAIAQRYEEEIAAIEIDLLGEIERLQRDAVLRKHETALRERALTRERDDYKAQLDFATSTKAWRMSVTYWRARTHGALGVFWLLGQLIGYVLRVIYHLSVPYPLRLDLWYRRHTGMSYRNHNAQLAAQSSASDDAEAQRLPTTPADVANIQKALGPDILCFAMLPWDDSSERQRRVMQIFADAGHRCCWLNPHMGPANEREAVVRTVSATLDEIILPGDGRVVTDTQVFRKSAVHFALGALRHYCSERDLRDVLCVVQHPGWISLVEELRWKYGWRVVYDLTDAMPTHIHVADQGKSDEPPSEDDRRERLFAICDLVITGTPAIVERQSRQLASVALAPDTSAYSQLMEAIRDIYGHATIIIVSYHNLDKLQFTLQSVLEKTRYPAYDILIVDNGGQPDIQREVRTLAQRFPETVRFIFNTENLGFAGGNNIGLRSARDSDYIILLNDDVVVTPGWLSGLIRYLGDRSIGLVGPVTNATGNEACIRIDYSDPADADLFARRYTAEHDGVSFDIAVLAMYCVAIRQDTLAEIGDLDERFGVGMFEDDDFSVRVHNAGYRIVCAEDVYVHHFGRSSFGQLGDEAYNQLFEANRTLFEQKWQTTWIRHKYREGY